MKAFLYILIAINQWNASSNTSDFDILFDERFSINKHTSSTCKVAKYHLRNIAHIRRHLDDFSLKTVVHALVMIRLDYCNSVLYGLPPYQTARLQHVQNAAVWLFSKTQKLDHVASTLLSLHWWPL